MHTALERLYGKFTKHYSITGEIREVAATVSRHVPPQALRAYTPGTCPPRTCGGGGVGAVGPQPTGDGNINPELKNRSCNDPLKGLNDGIVTFWANI